MVRSMSLWRQNKAAYTELLTPLTLKAGVVLMKREGDKNGVPAGLIAELAAAYGCNSRMIRRIGAAFRAKISRPGAFDIHRCHEGNCGRRPNAIDEVQSKVLGISPIKRQMIRELAARTDMPKSTIFLEHEGNGHDSSTLEHMWQALFHMFDATLSHDGGKDFPVPHPGTGAAQIRGCLLWTWHVKANSWAKPRCCLGAGQRGRA